MPCCRNIQAIKPLVKRILQLVWKLLLVSYQVSMKKIFLMWDFNMTKYNPNLSEFRGFSTFIFKY